MSVPAHTQVDVQWFLPQRMPTQDMDGGRHVATRGWRQPLSPLDLMISDTSMQAARGVGGPAQQHPLLQGREVQYSAFGPNVLATDRVPREAPDDGEP